MGEIERLQSGVQVGEEGSGEPRAPGNQERKACVSRKARRPASAHPTVSPRVALVPVRGLDSRTLFEVHTNGHQSWVEIDSPPPSKKTRCLI